MDGRWCQGTNSDRRGYVPTDAEGRYRPTATFGSLRWTPSLGVPASAGAQQLRPGTRALLSVRRRQLDGLEASGSPANWRCMKLEKFSRIELLEGVWHTAPNHSRPQSCITDVDVDAEDYPDRNPHSGQ